MKYLLADWGVEKFRTQVETYLGKKLGQFKHLPAWQYLDFLGWHEQGDGKLFLGISVENGRIKNEGKFQLKTVLRKIVEQYQLPMRLTANHNILLYEIDPKDQEAITKLLESHGIVTDPNKIDTLVRYSMACPALPTCSLAVTESERAIPSINARIRKLLQKVGLGDESIVIRMTGCPNGCARPYMAEIGFVGIVPDTYQIWLGGTPNQTQLARAYTDKLNVNQLESFFEPLFVYFKQDRKPQESFGEFCDRVDFESLREFSASYQPIQERKNQRRVSVPDGTFEKLKAASLAEKRPMNQIVEEALTAYFAQK
jgi:sulfite reductase (ferredoxin)